MGNSHSNSSLFERGNADSVGDLKNKWWLLQVKWTRERWLHWFSFDWSWNVMSSIRCFMSFSNFINWNISKTNRTSGWDPGTGWHLRNQSHFDRTLDDTCKDHSLIKKKKRKKFEWNRLGQEDDDSWLLLLASPLTKKFFRMEKTGTSNETIRRTLQKIKFDKIALIHLWINKW